MTNNEQPTPLCGAQKCIALRAMLPVELLKWLRIKVSDTVELNGIDLRPAIQRLIDAADTADNAQVATADNAPLATP